MGLFLRILSIVGLLVFLMSAALAIGLYWEFNFGDCKDGCPEGMAYALFLPAMLTALISLIVALTSHRIGKRVMSKQQ